MVMSKIFVNCVEKGPDFTSNLAPEMAPPLLLNGPHVSFGGGPWGFPEGSWSSRGLQPPVCTPLHQGRNCVAEGIEEPHLHSYQRPECNGEGKATK